MWLNYFQPDSDSLMPPRSTNPRSVQGVRILQRQGGNELTKQYPGVSGFLEAALMGTAPDAMGSVLDPLTSERRKGAEYGYPLGIGAQVAPMVGGLGKFAKAVATAPSMLPGSRAAQRGVIKMKGGNWLSGSVEDALKGLKRPEGNMARQMEAVHGQRIAPIPEADRADALNNWIDKQLARYVKNEMATPEDPIRALAERGVLHYEPGVPRPGQVKSAGNLRSDLGYPVGGYAESDLARKFETISDSSLDFGKAGGLSQFHPEQDWLKKVPADTTVFEVRPDRYIAEDLGFPHLLDELRNATNPASGLPRELLLKYESLPQVSVPQAVERVAKINEWRAAQKAEANAAKANNAATALHKEYPDKGFKWVELKANRPQDVEVVNDGVNFVVKRGDEVLGRYASERTANQMADKVAEPVLKDALKYEGETMGHCVGGYCPDVLEGKSRIFSLRSAKGEPHVTIETTPGHRAPEGALSAEQLPPEVVADFKARNILDPRHAYVYDEAAGRYLPTLASTPDRIVQIKGKANRAPNPEYLPFVQDFVKSGKWSDVGDLQNTGMKAYTGPKGTQYMTDEEYAPIRQRMIDERDAEPGYAAGGLVNQADSGYNPARVAELTQQLRAELFPQ